MKPFSMFSLEYLTFAQIITVLHKNFQKLFETGNWGGGGGGGGLAPPARTPMQCFHMVIPVGQQVRQRRLYGNLALYEKWKPPETTTCKPGLTQAFLQVAQQAISLIKPLLHFEAFR